MEKDLSKAGREILIKAVAQAIPNYTMSCLKLPVSLCDDINSIITRFWWGQKEKNEQRKNVITLYNKLFHYFTSKLDA